MTPETEQQYKNQIAALQAEIEKLKNQQTKAIQREKYGLNWIDVPEEFDEKSKNSIPVLKEIKEKAIKNDDGKPTHILIEGDNYHALTCLNYTHAGKIDVIYIDPPYNTGSDGFTYKDARFMTEFPNGKTVPKDDPLRHSTWLSFMEKRLRLAKNLLSDKGVIFISIDDNEQANLKLLCDKIFGEKNFVANFIWRKKSGGGQTTEHFAIEHEYILLYAKHSSNFKVMYEEIPFDEKLFNKRINGENAYLTKLEMWGTAPYKEDRPSLHYPIKAPNGTNYYPKAPDGRDGRWRKKPELLNEKNIFWKEIEGRYIPYEVTYQKDVIGLTKKIMPRSIFYNLAENTDATKDIISIFGKRDFFAYSKPKKLIQQLLTLSSTSNSTILDFFAGSGTTMHATMKLNAEDGGNRQCILVQQQENDSNICETITYERNRRVMQGYINAKGEEIAGLGNSLKYYKTDFIGKNKPEKATDEDRITLAQKAGYLISLVENTLEEIETNDFYQIFSNAEENQFTAIYFNGDTEKFPDFVQSIQEKNKKTIVYIFTWGSPDIFENEFDDLSNITIKSIPQPILEIYKSLMKNEE